MKTKIIFVFFCGLSIVSCHAFYEFSSETVDKEMHRTYKMALKSDTLDFNAYNDYYYDTINLDVVYITPKELKKIRKATVSSSPIKQILFLHNDTPYYLNIIGYYYSDLYLSEIQPPNFAYQPIKLTKGLGFNFDYDEMQISDFYIPYSNGVLRFIAVGNPEWNKKNPERFKMEIDFVFYTLNRNLFRPKDEISSKPTRIIKQ